MSALSIDTLKARVPSIFTGHSSDKTSDKYKVIPTIEIVEQLAAKGFNVVKAMQANTRIVGNHAYTKHMLRFRHDNAVPNQAGLFPELVLVNSHDGQSSYRLMAGIYRMVCANGLIAGSISDEVRVRHQGDILGDVIEGTYRVIDTATQMIEQSSVMSDLSLTDDERVALAKAAVSLKFDEPEAALNPIQFLQARNRHDSEHKDLFTTFNVLQENLIKGGIRTYRLNDNGQRIARTRTREVKSISENVRLNKALWSLTEEMLKLKTV